MRICINCGVKKNDGDFYVLSNRNCKPCWKRINLRQHQVKFKYISRIYQCILFRLNLTAKKNVNSCYENSVIGSIVQDDDFDLKFLESIRKRLIQRCARDQVRPEINKHFKEIADEIKRERINKAIKQGE